MTEALASNFTTVSSMDGGQFHAYTVRPDRTPAPTIVLLQEIFGVNDAVRDIAHRFAERGFLVLVPDLYWRMEPGVQLGFSRPEMKRAFDFMTRLDDELAIQDIDATVRVARTFPESNGRVAVVGFCLGGRLAFDMAIHGGVDAAISFYGVGIDEPQRLGRREEISCPLQLHYGSQDTHIPAEARDTVAEALLVGKPHVDVFVYEDAGHGFFNRHRDSYHEASAELALERSLNLLNSVLDGVG